MKRVLFVIPSFAIGGVTSSLYSLLQTLDYNKVEVNLFCRHHVGNMQDKFQVFAILPENIWLSLFITKGNIIQKVLSVFLRALRICLRCIGIDLYPFYSKIGGKQIKTNEYDAIISFHEGLSPIVCYYPAKKRIAWIHCDYSRQLEAIGRSELKYYKHFDDIVCVSKYAQSVFNEIYSDLSNRTHTVYNIINTEDVRKKVLDISQFDKRFTTDSFTIISIGRLDPIKQFNKIPLIAKDVQNLTSKVFKWYIIGGSRGFTAEEELIKKQIRDNNLEDFVILLGEKSNVYPYLANSDLYVCTSASEAFSLTIDEAKALSIPVLTNDLPCVRERFIEGRDGWITSLGKMASQIIRIMEGDTVSLDSQFSNDDTLNSFYELIGVKKE